MTFVRLSLLTALAACHAAPQPTVAQHAAPPPKLGPTITSAELQARLADHRLQPIETVRLTDGPQAMPTRGTPFVTVEANVISALSCRPGGEVPVLIADSRYVYVTYASSRLMTKSDPNGRPMATPSTYCSYQRFQIPDGLAFGGPLQATEAAADALR